MKTNSFDDILQECLDRLARGETVAQCFAAYPEQAGELKPLLEAAMVARKAAALAPRPAFRLQARTLFREALYDMEKKRRPHVFQWRMAWTVSVAVVCFLVLSGASTIVAANNSMPDSVLYPVKLLTEQAMVVLAPSPIRKATINVELANRRVEEIEYVARKGDEQKVAVVAWKLSVHLEDAATLAEQYRGNGNGSPANVVKPGPDKPSAATRPTPATPREALGSAIRENAANARARLQAVMEKAPPGMRPVLARAIEESQTRYEKALKSVEREPGKNT